MMMRCENVLFLYRSSFLFLSIPFSQSDEEHPVPRAIAQVLLAVQDDNAAANIAEIFGRAQHDLANGADLDNAFASEYWNKLRPLLGLAADGPQAAWANPDFVHAPRGTRAFLVQGLCSKLSEGDHAHEHIGTHTSREGCSSFTTSILSAAMPPDSSCIGLNCNPFYECYAQAGFWWRCFPWTKWLEGMDGGALLNALYVALLPAAGVALRKEIDFVDISMSTSFEAAASRLPVSFEREMKN
jgi:hypothetical protein